MPPAQSRGRKQRGPSGQSATFANFFFPRRRTIPPDFNFSSSRIAWTSVTFSSATMTPPCSMARRPSDRLVTSFAAHSAPMRSIFPSLKEAGSSFTASRCSVSAPPAAKSLRAPSWAALASSSPWKFLALPLLVLADLLEGQEGQKLQALDDIGIAHVPPVLVELKG